MVDSIRTERLLLRSLEESDRAEFVRVHELSADHFRPWLPARDDSTEDLFGRELQKAANSAVHLRWVAQSTDGRLVGFFNLGEIVRGVFQNAYASWAVSAEFAGQGYAGEGVNALLDLAFSRGKGAGLHRVQANIIPENERSIRVAERAGMRREGIALRYLTIAGEWRDHIMFAKTVEEHTPRYLV